MYSPLNTNGLQGLPAAEEPVRRRLRLLPAVGRTQGPERSEKLRAARERRMPEPVEPERAALRELPGPEPAQLRMPPERRRLQRTPGQVRGDVNIPDEDVPLDDGEDLRDLDDEDVPLADLRADQQWRMGYLPAYAGIGLAALILLAGAAVYLKKKHKNTASGK